MMSDVSVRVIATLFSFGLVGALGAVDEEPLNWGGRAAHPAVVNPVLPAGEVLSLRGEWEFSVPGRDLPNRNGVWGNFNAKQEWKSPRPIRVPGCWEAQGVGEEGESVTWDPSWDCCPRRIRHKHMGEGWYRKRVKVPESWKGRRIWLKVGGVKSVGWFWVNDVQVAHVGNYCGTEKYDITDLVEPGKEAKIVVDVDNRKPSRKGLMSASHRWGGIYRDVELEATPMACFIDDAWVRGDYDKQEAEVHVEVNCSDCSDCSDCSIARGCRSVRAEIDGEVVEQAIEQSNNPNNRTILKVPLRNFRPWSPEHPNLYTAKVELVEDGRVVQSRQERFGVRKLEVVGKEFRLNGRPFFVRGFGDDSVYPLTGLPPADRTYHLAHLAKARAAGFNFVRLHTHCELPEYFEAADELGVLVQAELPYYSDVPCEGFEFDPVRDVKELYRNYRRHPSFAVYSMGNEGSFGKVLDRRIHRLVKEMDSDRLKINQDTNQEHLSSPDVSDYAGGPIMSWPRGSYDPGRPFVCHEFLNLCVKTDARTAEKYTGAWMPPVTRKSRGEWLARFGLGHDWGDRLQDAQHALQAVWQKRGIEQARLDPHCGGYCFWTINDVVVWNSAAQTYSAQGLFDPFWADKRRGNSAADFARFNSGSCVLVDFCPTQCVFTAGDRFRADVFLAHYGEEPMRAAQATWRLSAGGRLLASGSASAGDQPLGAVRRVAAFDVTVPAVGRPEKASFAVTVGDVGNAWDLWLFPKGPSLAEIRAKAAKLGVVIAAEKSAEAVRACREGRPLITVDGTDGKPNVELGWWWMGPQVGTAIRPDRALGAFPHEGVLTPLLFRILKKGRELPAADMHPDDMIIVGEGGEKCYLYLGERQGGAARAFECHGLDLLSDLPEGNCLLDALVDEAARKRPLRVVAFGDSITEAVIGIRPEESWLSLLQSDMGGGVRFFNAGVGGNSAREAMQRFDRDVLARRPDVVLIEFGGNNHSPRNPERRVNDEEFRGHLEDFSRRLPPGTRVVAVTFPPIKDDWHGYGRDPFFKNGLDEAMQPQREILRAFAREHGWPIVDLYNVMKDRRETLLLRDGVHLNPDGQRVFADEVKRVLRDGGGMK